MLGCTIPPAFLRVSEEGGEQSTGAWRKQLRREVVSGGSSAVKHGTWRKWLHRSGAACGEGSSGGRQHLEAAAAQNMAPEGRGTLGEPYLEAAAPWGTALPGNGAAGNGTCGERRRGRAVPSGVR